MMSRWVSSLSSKIKVVLLGKCVHRLPPLKCSSYSEDPRTLVPFGIRFVYSSDKMIAIS